MKNLENLPEEIFDLIAQKEFSALTETEKQLVLTYITQEEYESFNLIVSDFQDLEKNRVNKNEPTATKPPSKIRKILNHPIPFYQVAAAFLIFCFASFLLFNSAKQSNQSPAEPSIQAKGKSLVDENYPDELVLNF